MDELKLALTGTQLAQKAAVTLAQSLRVGQIVSVTVIDKPAPGTLLLQLGTQQVSAKADIPVQIGAALTLQVSSLGATPTLRVFAPGNTGVGGQVPLDTFLKLLMPVQGNPAAPVQTLLDPAKNANILSLLGLGKADIERILKTLNQNALPVEAGAVKQSVEKSGLFLEANLRSLLETSGPLLPGDFKAVLLSLLGSVKLALAKAMRHKGNLLALDDLVLLQQELEAALATITLKQLSVLQAHERGACFWSFDIPVRLNDEAHCITLTVERDDSAAKEEGASEDWKVLLSVTLPQLGPIEAELFMRGSKVSVVIYAEHGQTVQLMDENLHRLKLGLEHAGLSVSVLLCHQGNLGERSWGEQWSECVDEKV